MGCIYLITNTINGKQYVGKTMFSHIARWKTHCKDANNDRSTFLCNAIRKYGKESFKIEVLEESGDENFLLEREIYWIEQLKTFSSGYNSTSGGEGTSGHNYIISDENKQKLSEILKGNQRRNWKGKTHREETKKKMSESAKERWRKIKGNQNDSSN